MNREKEGEIERIMRKQKENYLTHWKVLTKKIEQTRMLFGPEQRVHTGRITVTDPL